MKPILKTITVAAIICATVMVCFAVIYFSQPKQKAEHSLKKFLRGCQKMDGEMLAEYSHINDLAPILMPFIDDKEYDDDGQMCCAMMDMMNSPDSYSIESGRPAKKSISEIKNLVTENLKKETEIAAYVKEKKDIELDLSGTDCEQALIDFLGQVEDAYTFNVTLKTDGNKETDELTVVKYNGKWGAAPFLDDLLIPSIHYPEQMKEELGITDDAA